MEYLIAIIALTVFGRWGIDDLAVILPITNPRLTAALKFIILIIGMYFIAKSAGVI